MKVITENILVTKTVRSSQKCKIVFPFGAANPSYAIRAALTAGTNGHPFEVNPHYDCDKNVWESMSIDAVLRFESPEYVRTFLKALLALTPETKKKKKSVAKKKKVTTKK